MLRIYKASLIIISDLSLINSTSWGLLVCQSLVNDLKALLTSFLISSLIFMSLCKSYANVILLICNFLTGFIQQTLIFSMFLIGTVLCVLRCVFISMLMYAWRHAGVITSRLWRMRADDGQKLLSLTQSHMKRLHLVRFSIYSFIISNIWLMWFIFMCSLCCGQLTFGWIHAFWWTWLQTWGISVLMTNYDLLY